MKTSGRSRFMRIMEPLKRHKKTAIICLLTSIWWALIPNVLTIIIQKGIDALTHTNEHSFLTYATLLCSIYLIWFFIQYPSRTSKWIGMDKIAQDIYDRTLTHFTKLDNNAIESYGTGKVNNIISKGLHAQLQLIEMILTSRIRVVIQFILSIGLVVYYLGRYAGAILVVALVIIICIGIKSNKRLAPIRKLRREQTTFIDGLTIKHIMSKFEILQNNKAGKEAQKRGVYRQKKYNYLGIESKRMILIWEGQKLAMDVLRMAAYIYAGYAVLHGDMTLGFFSAVWMLTNSTNQGLFDITENLIQYNQNIVNLDKLREFMDKEQPIKGYEEGKTFIYNKGNISFNNITYNYGKGEVLKDFSLHINGGEKTAFVGISGGGKSTIIKLIAGYIHPLEGDIRIDDQVLPNETNGDYVSLKSYYTHIGYLTQEPNVFDGTIYENLTYALDYEPTQEQIDTAIKGAQCQFIHEFPDGIQTEIGEKGIKLSGGQRQRLAIAKVMLKNPQIILLDEPTSSLDSFSEEEVTKAFNNLFMGRTVVVIAHRLQTVKKADRIIVLDHGKIVEEGNHDSLVKSGGVYAKMLELQSGF